MCTPCMVVAAACVCAREKACRPESGGTRAMWGGVGAHYHMERVCVHSSNYPILGSTRIVGGTSSRQRKHTWLRKPTRQPEKCLPLTCLRRRCRSTASPRSMCGAFSSTNEAATVVNTPTHIHPIHLDPCLCPCGPPALIGARKGGWQVTHAVGHCRKDRLRNGNSVAAAAGSCLCRARRAHDLVLLCSDGVRIEPPRSLPRYTYALLCDEGGSL